MLGHSLEGTLGAGGAGDLLRIDREAGLEQVADDDPMCLDRRVYLDLGALDIIEYVDPRLVAGPAGRPVDALGLHRRDEALHGGFVLDVARPVDRAGDTLMGKQAFERLAAVLAAASRIMQHGLRLCTAEGQMSSR